MSLQFAVLPDVSLDEQFVGSFHARPPGSAKEFRLYHKRPAQCSEK
jgi:hypothetical protein